MRYLDPRNDLTFKKVFGEHPDLLISFLNALMPFASEDDYIESVEYLPAEIVPETPFSKDSIVDVRCFDKQGRQFIVEMQMYWTDDFLQRVLFNSSKAYVRQLDRGRRYSDLQPVYSLSLVNDVFRTELKDAENCYHHYSIVDVYETNEHLKGMEFVFVELPKFKPKNFRDKKMVVLWLRYLTEVKDQTESVPKELLDNRYTKKALQLLEEASYSKSELYAYDRYWDAVSTHRTLLYGETKKARERGFAQGHAEGLAQGHAEGHAEGLAQGHAEGLAQGHAEGLAQGHEQTNIANARRMKELGATADFISQVTGLSLQEISNL